LRPSKRDINSEDKIDTQILLEKITTCEPRVHSPSKPERLFKLARKKSQDKQRSHAIYSLRPSKLPLPFELNGWSIFTSKEEL
jgi:hypothetical protein